MARPPITAKFEGLFRQQLNAALDYVESLGGGAPAWGAITGTLADQTDLDTALAGKQAAGSYAASSHTHAQSEVTGLVAALAAKQDTLVSATNIKTINGASVLGSGDLTVSGSGGGSSPAVAWVI